MTTIEERREIAAKLRSRSDDEEFHSENPMARGVHLLIAICESVFHDRRAREMASEQDMLNRLADLIDPTCLACADVEDTPESNRREGGADMAVTDDERRLVAKRLRGDPCDTLIPCRTGVHFGMGCHEAANRFWDMCERIKSAGDYDIAHSTRSVLADLIEPGGHECVPGECPLNVRHDNDRIDQERLLAIATVMAADSVRSAKQGSSVSPVYILHAARNIAEACGETFGSIRNRELAKWGTSIVPKEMIVDRDALLALADEIEEHIAQWSGIEDGDASDIVFRIREAVGE